MPCYEINIWAKRKEGERGWSGYSDLRRKDDVAFDKSEGGGLENSISV